MKKLYICDVRGLQVPEIFNRKILEVSEERRVKALKYKPEKNRLLSLGAGLLLIHALEACGIAHDDAVSMKLYYGDNGKAYIADERYKGKLFFNLSHSGDLAACAISDSEIGADIQQYRKFETGLVRATLSDDELRQYNSLPESDRTAFFYQLWSDKEAYVKFTGIGIHDKPATIETSKLEGLRFIHGAFEDYSYSVCSASAEPLEGGIHWYDARESTDIVKHS